MMSPSRKFVGSDRSSRRPEMYHGVTWPQTRKPNSWLLDHVSVTQSGGGTTPEPSSLFVAGKRFADARGSDPQKVPEISAVEVPRLGGVEAPVKGGARYGPAPLFTISEIFVRKQGRSS